MGLFHLGYLTRPTLVVIATGLSNERPRMSRPFVFTGVMVCCRSGSIFSILYQVHFSSALNWQTDGFNDIFG